MTEYLVFDKLADEFMKRRKEPKLDGMAIFVLGVNIGEKSVAMVEHGFRVGVSGLLSGQARERAH